MTTVERPQLTIKTATRLLTTAKFTKRAWPAGGRPRHQWLFEFRNRHNRISIILGRKRGHQVVVSSLWNGERWVIRGEYDRDDNGQPYTVDTAVKRGLELVEALRSAA